jgi:hypothetical protein
MQTVFASVSHLHESVYTAIPNGNIERGSSTSVPSRYATGSPKGAHGEKITWTKKIYIRNGMCVNLSPLVEEEGVKHAQNLIILAYLAQLVCNCKRATVSQ